jgi:hypothetical protein
MPIPVSSLLHLYVNPLLLPPLADATNKASSPSQREFLLTYKFAITGAGCVSVIEGVFLHPFESVTVTE